MVDLAENWRKGDVRKGRLESERRLYWKRMLLLLVSEKKEVKSVSSAHENEVTSLSDLLLFFLLPFRCLVWCDVACLSFRRKRRKSCEGFGVVYLICGSRKVNVSFPYAIYTGWIPVAGTDAGESSKVKEKSGREGKERKKRLVFLKWRCFFEAVDILEKSGN